MVQWSKACVGRFGSQHEAFKVLCNLQDMVERVLRNQQQAEKVPGVKRTLSVQASLMILVQPMLVMLALLPW